MLYFIVSELNSGVTMRFPILTCFFLKLVKWFDLLFQIM
jgi:hypothetical protein